MDIKIADRANTEAIMRRIQAAAGDEPKEDLYAAMQLLMAQTIKDNTASSQESLDEAHAFATMVEQLLQLKWRQQPQDELPSLSLEDAKLAAGFAEKLQEIIDGTGNSAVREEAAASLTGYILYQQKLSHDELQRKLRIFRAMVEGCICSYYESAEMAQDTRDGRSRPVLRLIKSEDQ